VSGIVRYFLAFAPSLRLVLCYQSTRTVRNCYGGIAVETEVLTVEEAGKRLQLSRISAYRAVRRGQLPALKFGRRLVVPVKALERMLETGVQAGQVAGLAK